MRMATLAEPEQIVLSEVEKPVPADCEVLIKVEYVGICGSDIHAYHGKHPFIHCPVTPGHEFVGSVVDMGRNVVGISPGERVTAMPQIFCHTCEQCKSGRYNICNSLKVIGCQTPGAACDYFAFDKSLVKKIPPELPSEIAATIEPAAVGAHAVKRGVSVAGRNVVVLGAGTIGNVTAQAAIALGAKSVLITDLFDERLETAKRCGIPHTANIKNTSLRDALGAAFGAEGADIWFECAGVTDTVNQAIEFSKKGGDIIIVGVFSHWGAVNMGLVQDKELRLIGSLMYTEPDYDDAIKWLVDGTVNTKPLISKIFSLDNYAEAFRYIDANADKCMKVLIQI